SIGNTEYAAMEIQRQTGGDLFAIKTVKDYPVSHSECSEIAEKEMRTDERPELSSHLENMDEYDVVYIGYPIWWYAEPMAIRSFIEEYDFSGKTVIPFCTTLGAGIGKSEKNIADLADGAAVLEGITLRSERQDFGDDIALWLSDIGMAN
ncbi:MAG: flavodoxin, partial [Ruminococcus sp.]|nr:flavodoxin [Ruminococcus sp.]